jgi:hypothetical protein
MINIPLIHKAITPTGTVDTEPKPKKRRRTIVPRETNKGIESNNETESQKGRLGNNVS